MNVDDVRQACGATRIMARKLDEEIDYFLAMLDEENKTRAKATAKEIRKTTIALSKFGKSFRALSLQWERQGA